MAKRTKTSLAMQGAGLEAGLWVSWSLPIASVDEFSQVLGDSYLLPLAFDPCGEPEEPCIWMGHSQEGLLLGVDGSEWIQLQVWLHLAPSDAHLVGLEGYSYKLEFCHDSQGQLQLQLAPALKTGPGAGVGSGVGSGPCGAHGALACEGQRGAWLLSRAQLKGLQLAPGACLQMALCWLDRRGADWVGWPVREQELLLQTRQYWAQLHLQ